MAGERLSKEQQVQQRRRRLQRLWHPADGEQTHDSGVFDWVCEGSGGVRDCGGGCIDSSSCGSSTSRGSSSCMGDRETGGDGCRWCDQEARSQSLGISGSGSDSSASSSCSDIYGNAGNCGEPMFCQDRKRTGARRRSPCCHCHSGSGVGGGSSITTSNSNSGRSPSTRLGPSFIALVPPLLLLLLLCCSLIPGSFARAPRLRMRRVRHARELASKTASPGKSPSKGKKAKPPPPRLRIQNYPPISPPSPPFLARLPPDLPPPPYPPLRPPVAQASVGRVNDLQDVCTLCTNMQFNSTCSSTFTSQCLTAIDVYRANVLQVADRVCDCYTQIATQLINLCPGVNGQIAYLGNCDQYCYYGPRCPFIPTVFALMHPRNVIVTDTTVPVASGFSAVVLNLLPSLSAPHTIAYRFITSASLDGVPQAAGIYLGGMGTYQQRPEQLLFTVGQASNDLSGTVVTSFALMRRIVSTPTSFYVQMDTTSGSIRGQCTFVPYLFSLADNTQVPATCPGFDCSATVNLAFTSFAVYYRFGFGQSVRNVLGSMVVEGVVGESGIKLFDFFGPGIAPFSAVNGITASSTTILSLLAAPEEHYISFTTQDQPFGALRGQFSDVMYVQSVLYGSLVVTQDPDTGEVVQGSGVPGSAYFRAALGGGGICYSFTLYGVNPVPTYSYIHSGNVSMRGAIAVLATLTLNTPPNSQRCVDASTAATANIISNPSSFYVQLYSPAQPGGMLRGQLSFVPGQRP